MTSKEKYKKLCVIEQSISIYSQHWWLDAVCGSCNWDVILYEKGGEIIGSLVYYTKNVKGLKYIAMPQLTQTGGIWLKDYNSPKTEKKLSFEKEVMLYLISELEKLPIVYYQQCFSPAITNWLPFYWKGYQQTTRYTYIIEDIRNPEKNFETFSHGKRKNIKKASEANLSIKFDLSSEKFYENHKMTLQKQGQKISYDYKLFSRIYSAVYENNSGRVIYADDSNGNIHAALFVIWDNSSGYDLISTIDPDFRSIGAANLLVYEVIKFLSDKVKSFDFEGSMIEDVENSFRQFGTVQKPYFSISKILTKNPILKMLINKKLNSL